MTLTLADIKEHQERLRREIVERECLLAAFNVLHGYVGSGQGPQSLQLGSLASALVPSAAGTQKQLPDAPASTAPAQPSPPAEVPVPAYIHPELRAIGSRFGNNGKYVSWAIERMTEDYTLCDIAALLKHEGYPLSPSKISVVLSRLKSRGEIEEVQRGKGRRAAVFRKPASTIPLDAKVTDHAGGEECSAESSAMVGGETVPTPAAAA